MSVVELLRPAMAAALLAAIVSPAADAFTVTVRQGNRMLYLQVGTGTVLFPRPDEPVPADNSTVDRVSITVPAAAVTDGTPLPMTGNSTTTVSPQSQNPICPAATDVFIGGLLRVPGNGNNNRTATLNVSTALPLAAGTSTIPFTEIEWDSVGINDSSPTVASGSFAGTANQVLATINDGTWFEGCLRFRFRNTQPYPAGDFTGTAVYTLTAP